MKKTVNLLFLFFLLLSLSSTSAISQEKEDEENVFTKGGRELKDKIPENAIKKIDETFGEVREKLKKQYLALKGGVSSGLFRIDAKKNTQDIHSGWGFNTHFGYHWYKWELTASSYVSFGDVSDLSFEVNGDDIQGDGKLRFVSISPNIRYYTDWWFYEGWRFYVGAGPIWTLKTIKFDRYDSEKTLGEDRKLTYESRGAMLILGVEELLPLKQLHPVYVELATGFTVSRELSVVDNSTPAETEILSSEPAHDEVQNYAIVLSLGITLF